MWNEFQDQIKSKLLFILYVIKIIYLQNFAPSYDDVSHETFHEEGMPSEETLNRWKFIIEMFDEQGFILIDQTE